MSGFLVICQMFGCLTRASHALPTRTEADILESILLQDPNVTSTRVVLASEYLPDADEPITVCKRG
jgi:hypothetical protein